MIDIEEFTKNNEIFDGHFKLLRPLSTDGGTADVWLAIDTNTIDTDYESDDSRSESAKNENSGMLVAIKIYRPKNALDIEGEQRFRDEYKIVYECRHENLLQPTSFSIFEGTPYLVLPYCKHGSSELLIGQSDMPTDEIWKYIHDVASGLNRLHTNEPQIVHQDIKPANVLIDNCKNYVITDFGISSKRGGTHGYYYDDENSGTLAYMAPERFGEDAEPIAASDIWGFGATLCEILTGQVPFGEEGGRKQTDGNTPMPSIPGVHQDIVRLIHACLSYNPADRPTAAQLKEAAQAKQYPVKSKIWLFVGGGVLAALVLAVILYLVFPESTPTPIQSPTNEELYNAALVRMNSDNVDTLRKGLEEMEELCNKNYIPALYQVAFTYGWYSDSASLSRKELLGIEVFEEDQEPYKDQYMPVQGKYNDNAVALLTRITDQNDSAYAEINAQAWYRRACYLAWPNRIYRENRENFEKGKFFLEQSLEWAEIANDEELKKNIDNGNLYIKNKLSKKNNKK